MFTTLLNVTTLCAEDTNVSTDLIIIAQYIQKEVLALPLPLQHFVYVGSIVFPVVVYTGHNLLGFLSHADKNADKRLMRWFKILILKYAIKGN